MIKFEPITYENAGEIAALHVSGIRTGFISSLGLDFVTALYQGVTESESSFGFLAMNNGKVLGFVVFANNVNAQLKLQSCT